MVRATLVMSTNSAINERDARSSTIPYQPVRRIMLPSQKTTPAQKTNPRKESRRPLTVTLPQVPSLRYSLGRFWGSSRSFTFSTCQGDFQSIEQVHRLSDFVASISRESLK